MQPRWNITCWIVTLLGLGCIRAWAEPFAKGPYLGQTPPGAAAQVFAPELICHTGPRQWESDGSFSVDGSTFCYAHDAGILITENTDEGWTVPQQVGVSQA